MKISKAIIAAKQLLKSLPHVIEVTTEEENKPFVNSFFTYRDKAMLRPKDIIFAVGTKEAKFYVGLKFLEKTKQLRVVPTGYLRLEFEVRQALEAPKELRDPEHSLRLPKYPKGWPYFVRHIDEKNEGYFGFSISVKNTELADFILLALPLLVEAWHRVILTDDVSPIPYNHFLAKPHEFFGEGKLHSVFFNLNAGLPAKESYLNYVSEPRYDAGMRVYEYNNRNEFNLSEDNYKGLPKPSVSIETLGKVCRTCGNCSDIATTGYSGQVYCNIGNGVVKNTYTCPRWATYPEGYEHVFGVDLPDLNN